MIDDILQEMKILLNNILPGAKDKKLRKRLKLIDKNIDKLLEKRSKYA